MNWECNRCGYRVQPVKEVEPDGMAWPAGRACSRCLGEMVYRPIYKGLEVFLKCIKQYRI